MIIREHISQILDALNSGAQFGEKYEAWVDRRIKQGAGHNTLSARLKNPELFALMEPPLQWAPGADCNKATTELRDRLRYLVDEYIRTGIGTDGSESPRNRDPVSAFDSYVKNPTLHWVPQGNKLVPMFPLQPFPTAGLADPVEAAREEAERLFSTLMVSDWTITVFKCFRCGKYAQKPHPRNLYKSGARCRPCSSRASAQQLTDVKRQERNERLFVLASAGLNDWNRKERSTHPSEAPVVISRSRAVARTMAMKQFIASYVNERSGGYEKPITSKWVKRNLEIIRKLAMNSTD